MYRGLWTALVAKHAATLVGLPWSIVVALVIVLLLRTVAGEMQFRVLEFEFKGPSGPIIMWVICFLALILAVIKTCSL
jgi:hypothetical protein